MDRPPRNPRPRDQNQGSSLYAVYIRDQMGILSWLATGAVIQAALMTYPPRFLYSRLEAWWMAIPPAAWLVYGILRALVAASAYKPASYGQFTTKFTANFERDPESDGGVCVLLHRFKCYHPLGMLASRQTELLKLLYAMNDDLREKAEEHGYLGGNYYLGASESESNNEILMIYYFKNYDSVTKFAHSEVHRKGWKWWNDNLLGLGHMGISHEIYQAQAGSWETISMNFKPSGLTATTFAGVDDNGDKKWMSPVISARGKYLTSAGRMGHGTGDEHKQYDDAMLASEKHSLVDLPKL